MNLGTSVVVTKPGPHLGRIGQVVAVSRSDETLLVKFNKNEHDITGWLSFDDVLLVTEPATSKANG